MNIPFLQSRRAQRFAMYAAGVLIANPAPRPALAFVKFLAAPKAAAEWTKAGFERP